MLRVLSGIQPTGRTHLGNYLGALRQWERDQHEADSYYAIVDLHAITVEHSPASLRDAVLELSAVLFACGIDPEVATVFLQSQIPAHAQLGWVMECTATFGELSRMTQFKDKGRGSESIRAGLLTYPALMAADILLYQADRVPIGEDQKQHLELARDLVQRFNRLYGETLRLPEPAIPKIAARVMDLQSPLQKMSKSTSRDSGIVYLLDTPSQIKKKISRAVTDTDGRLVYEPENADKAGLNNLLEIYAALDEKMPEELAASFSGYGALKSELSDVLIAHLEPLQKRYLELISDKGELLALLGIGRDRANTVANETLSAVYEAVGFIVSPTKSV